MEPTNSWMYGYGKHRRCTGKRTIIVEFYLYLAATLTVIRRLINRARTLHRTSLAQCCSNTKSSRPRGELWTDHDLVFTRARAHLSSLDTSIPTRKASGLRLGCQESGFTT